MEILRAYALQLVGTPYRWGGSSPMGGMDCSGFVQELLASVGLDPVGDQTAQGLFDFFDQNGERNPKPGVGVLAFYGESVSKVIHVALLLDPYRLIEAGGGGAKVTTIEMAEQFNAFIRVRHLSHRPILALRKPRYTTIGLI